MTEGAKRYRLGIACLVSILVGPGDEIVNASSATHRQAFAPLPDGEPLVLEWPTPNQTLRDDPDEFFARTSANPMYGRPGWTRDCGNRFHRGCDIAPIKKTATGASTTVTFSDCETGREYDSHEPTYVPHDPVMSVCQGVVAEAVTDPTTSDFGNHVVIKHAWPTSGAVFYTLYGHLAEVVVEEGDAVIGGQRIGTMGQTSRVADARNWMAVTPHLHFEVWTSTHRPYDPAAFLSRYVSESDHDSR